MPMRRLVAVADAMPTAGLGHLGRSSAVVVALRARGVTVECVANGAPEGVEPVVAPPHLADEIRAAGMVVCLAGQTALEAACLGVPAVVVAAVDNQRPNARRLEATGAAVAVDLDGPLTEGIEALAGDRPRRAEMARAARAAVDGFGALRVAAAIDARLLRGGNDAGAPGRLLRDG
jgi:spore coat polysaccharide biosynthesis predicted glycosyltransferase SpsG